MKKKSYKKKTYYLRAHCMPYCACRQGIDGSGKWVSRWVEARFRLTYSTYIKNMSIMKKRKKKKKKNNKYVMKTYLRPKRRY